MVSEGSLGPAFQSEVHHLVVRELGASVLAKAYSWNLSFSFCKMGVIIIPTLRIDGVIFPGNLV